MVNRPDTASSKSTSSTRSRSPVRNILSRSNSDHDPKNKLNTKGNSLRGSTSYQSINKISNTQSMKGSTPLRRQKLNKSMEPSNPLKRGSPTSTSTLPEDNINVVVRVRPLNEKEKRRKDEHVIQFPGNGQLLCEGLPKSGQTEAQKPKLFSYNVVFEGGSTQDDILQYSGIKRLIEMAIEGFSCTAFCYGQTGSGKTHTLTGPPELFMGKPNPKHEDHGLVFRSFFYLFQLLQARQASTQFVLKASFLEIYNEKVIDLLNGSSRKPLAVRWSKKSRGFFVENLFLVDCEELDDLLAVLEEGMRNRSVGAHMMNDYSSRSHTMLTVHITSEQQAENGVFLSKQGKINFVDLAGSEMTKKTHSEGKTLEEANNINKSLMVLGYCIASLSDSKKRHEHIPYRDSKLTKLLADSLAGNGVTLMIACISPARSNISETINTLRYAARAKKIRTKPIIIMDPREALILSLKREVNSLKQENEHLTLLTTLNVRSLGISSEVVGTLESNERALIPSAPVVNLENLTELENNELSELVKLYIVENQALRSENNELFSTREMVIRDQEVVCRENERLLKKLEDVNSVCCRSPIIPARPAFSGDVLNFSTGSDTENNGTGSNYWRNPMSVMSASTDSMVSNSKYKSDLDGRVSSNETKKSDLHQKELDYYQKSDNINAVAGSFKASGSFEKNLLSDKTANDVITSNIVDMIN